MNPSLGFYRMFNGAHATWAAYLCACVSLTTPRPSAEGYTLGLFAAELGMGGLWLLGTHCIAPMTLRRLEPAERERRLASFNFTVLARLLLMLYLVHPGVSVAIFEVFSCTTLQSGVSYLDADVSVRCGNAEHRRYLGAAAFWLLAVTLGIPAFFIWLCYRFQVPHMARALVNNAFLKEAVQLAWQERMPQPDVDVRDLTVDNIAAEHLEALYAFFVHGKSAEEAADILAGRAPPVVRGAEDGSDAAKDGQQHLSLIQRARAAVTARVAAAKAAATAALKRAASLADLASLRRSSSCMHELSPSALEAVERRNLVLSELLEWCKTSLRTRRMAPRTRAAAAAATTAATRWARRPRPLPTRQPRRAARCRRTTSPPCARARCGSWASSSPPSAWSVGTGALSARGAERRAAAPVTRRTANCVARLLAAG